MGILAVTVSVTVPAVITVVVTVTVITLMPEKDTEPACGIPEIRPKSLLIVGGTEATPHSWPWQISLQDDVRGHFCGGSILSKRYVITAAQCVGGLSPSRFRVVAGKHDLKLSEATQQVIRVAAITVHENYNHGSTDIAILRLAEDIHYTPQVKPICLPRGDAAAFTRCITTGWGRTLGTGDETVLNQVQLPIVHRAVCSLRTWWGNSITNSMICAGYRQGGKSACNGDSGGPLVCQENGVYRLHGITSWVSSLCGRPRKPTVFTRVARFVDWVDAKSSGAFHLAPR